MQNIEFDISQSTVYYYIREKLWGTLRMFCGKEYKNYKDPFYLFWGSYALFRQGEHNEALNRCVKFQNKREIEYATVTAMIYYHEHATSPDFDTIEMLRKRQGKLLNLSGDKAILMASYFYIFNDNLSEAEMLIEGIGSSTKSIQTCKGWL